MSYPTLNIGIIGAGRIGQVHAEHLAHRIPTAKLSAITDINLDAAQACAHRFSIEKVPQNYQALLNDPDIDAVLICSSTDTHAQIIEEAARVGKHIFCEKPIDHDLHRIDRALAAVKKAGVKFQIGFNRRFDPNFMEIKNAIASGRIGEPHILRITSRDPAPPPIEYVKVSGGLFLDMTIHDFDMARYLIDSEVESVYAVGAVNIDPAIAMAGDIDTAVITLQFANGVMGTIDNSRQAIYGYDQRVEVFGSKGMISNENIAPHRVIYSNQQSIQAPLPLNFFMQRYIDSYILEIQAFVDCIHNDTPSPVNGMDGKMPVLIGLAAKRSLLEKRPVLLTEVENLAYI
jgi:myo-inositol 2-dehydrogenase / D-chiro-inositol 1-dehydrogenase